MDELMFELEDEVEAERSSRQAVYVDGLASAHMSFLSKTLNETHEKVTRAVHQALSSARQSKTFAQPVDPAALAAPLQEQGLSVKLRHAKGGGEGQAAFHALSNSFLVVQEPGAHQLQPNNLPLTSAPFPSAKLSSLFTLCCGGSRSITPEWVDECTAAATQPAQLEVLCRQCPASGCCTEFLVDPNFKSHFYVPRCTSRYQALVDLLPPVFVGPPCQLVHVVDWMSRELHCSYRRQGESLPPWRQRDSLLSRWLPRNFVDTPFPPHPSGTRGTPCPTPHAMSPHNPLIPPVTVGPGPSMCKDAAVAADRLSACCAPRHAIHWLPGPNPSDCGQRSKAAQPGIPTAAGSGWSCRAPPTPPDVRRCRHHLQCRSRRAEVDCASPGCGPRRRVHRVPLVSSTTLEGPLLAAVQGGRSPAGSLHAASPPDSPAQIWESGSSSPTSTLRYASPYDSCHEQQEMGGSGGSVQKVAGSRQQGRGVCMVRDRHGVASMLSRQLAGGNGAAEEQGGVWKGAWGQVHA